MKRIANPSKAHKPPRPVFNEYCHNERRAPELHKIHYSHDGRTIQAIEYYNPDTEFKPVNLKHLVFRGVKIFQIVTEEAFDERSHKDWEEQVGSAAILMMDDSGWLDQFSSPRLTKSHHYHINFRQAVLDVICDHLEARNQRYYGSSI